MNKRKKILITGGAGFIGFHLAKTLALQNHDVTIIDDLSRGRRDKDFKELLKLKKIRFKKSNLEKPVQISKKDFDFIFHLAAVVGVKNVIKQPMNVLEKNVKLLFSIMNFAKKQKKLKRFFFLSTSEIYAGSLKNKLLKFPTSEKSILSLDELNNKRSTYMLSKIYCEALVNFSKLPYTILRPHNIYGPRMGMSHVIPEITAKALKKNKTLKIVNSHHTRTFCYINDAIKMILKIMEKKNTLGKTYNLGDQRYEIKIKDLVMKIIKILKIKKKFKMDKNNYNASPLRRVPEMKKLFKDINYKIKSNFDVNLRETIEWYEFYLNKY